MKNYEDIGLGTSLKKTDSLADSPPVQTSGYELYSSTPRGGVKQLHVGQIYDVSASGSASDFVLGSNSLAIVTSTLSSKQGNNELFALHEFAFYTEATVGTNSHIWGGEGTVSDGNFEIYSYMDWGNTDNKNLKGKAALKNLDASGTMAFRNQWRYIIPPEDAS